MNTKQPNLIEQVRNVIRVKHYTLNTEKAYLPWIKRFILFHKKRYPAAMGFLLPTNINRKRLVFPWFYFFQVQ